MFDPKAANAANANASPPAAPGVALNASLTVPAPSNGNTWLGELAGLFLPKQKVPPTQPVAKQVMIGNLVIGVRPGIEINVVEPSPGVTVIVEYPQTLPWWASTLAPSWASRRSQTASRAASST
jgi:hypothetical protein